MMSKRKMLGVMTLMVACVMLGSGLGMIIRPEAYAEETVKTVVTSPFTEAVAKVYDSVVGINNYQVVRYSNSNYGNDWSDFFGFGFGFGNGFGYGNGRNDDRNDAQTAQEVLAATGSGVVIAEGYVLTNYHVVEKASALKVSMWEEGKEEATLFEATVSAFDENLDVAVLKVKDLKLAPVVMGDSDSLVVGDWAICIGNPLSDTFTRTVTAGIVSGLDRSIKNTSYDKYGRKETITNTMIQTDAAINNGNSGGGMFNVAGELMGIPTLKYSGSVSSTSAAIEGIGMCIPINAAKPLINDVLNGTVSRDNLPAEAAASSALTGKPRMGITITSNTATSSNMPSGGAAVTNVEEGGPADVAGMKVGDIIVDVNDTVITGVSQLQNVIGSLKEGDQAQVKVFRVTDQETMDGEYVDLVVTLAVIDEVAQ